MIKSTKLASVALSLVFSTVALAEDSVRVLIQNDLLNAIGAKAQVTDSKLDLSVAELTPEQRHRAHELSHEFRRCGGYELLDDNSVMAEQDIFSSLAKMNEQNEQYTTSMSFLSVPIAFNTEVANAVNMVSTANVQSNIEWISSYPTRHHASTNKNQHVMDAKAQVESWLQQSGLRGSVDLIAHSRTAQNSLRVRIEGSRAPNEIVVLGGHFDSISGWFSRNPSPGADDNASGSACLFEALRVVLSQGKAPERTLEFFWYAAEEVGLVGSKEIAISYKGASKDVVAVLQLDMTMFPGDGVFTLGSMTDYTSSWLRQVMADLNQLYVGATIIESQCGYGCSDHASWYRQGYPTLMPFESTMDSMNDLIHTENDVASSRTSYEHAAMFSKIAVAFAMELANSDIRQPY